IRRCAVLSLLLAAGGCQMLRPHEPAPPAPPPEPVMQSPLATHQFQFEPGKDEVVGELQVTRVQGEDTLPDIARRFNLGYEEIARANPSVDPGGTGARRVCR